jgi:predicted DNA-binding transcriptional regulator AlpA
MSLIEHFAYLLYSFGIAARPHPITEATDSRAPTVTELSPRAIEAIAARVIEVLQEHTRHLQHPESLIDVAELARQTGLSRTWIYEHARELGAIRLGDGPRARLRFNPDTVNRLLEREPAPRVEPAPAKRRRPIRAMNDIELLPITTNRPQAPASELFRRRSR